MSKDRNSALRKEEVVTSLDEAQTVEEIRDLDTSVKKEVAIEALSHLSPQEGAEAMRQSGLASPGQGTSNIGITLGQAIEGFNLELMLVVFTTSAAFLAGQLSPSPIGVR